MGGRSFDRPPSGWLRETQRTEFADATEHRQMMQFVAGAAVWRGQLPRRRRFQGISWKSSAELSPATSYAVFPSKLLAMIALRQAIKLKLGSATPRMCLAASWA